MASSDPWELMPERELAGPKWERRQGYAKKKQREYSLPWWTNWGRKVSAVVSWPPPSVPVEKKVPAGLPTNAPFFHSPPVESKTAFTWAPADPKRVGIPDGRVRHAARPRKGIAHTERNTG